jgi:branched-chain amino acid transport system permease protein
VVLTGWAGQVSLGQMAFVGVGAAVGGALTSHRGWDLALAAAVAGVAGGLAAVVVGYPALRRRGLTLAVSTLAFSLFVWSYFLNRTVYTGSYANWLPEAQIERGTILGIDISSETSMFFVSLVVLALALAMVVGLRHSRTGRVLIAIRENERAARAYGVNATRTGLAAFALSGFLAAVAGALYVHQQTGLSPDALKPEASLTLFTMVVIGGLGSLPGALLGATYVFSVEFFLPPEWQFLATGVGLLLVLLLFPSGFGGVLADVRDGALRRVAKRRGLIVPSLLADVRVEDLEEAPPEPVLAAAGEIAELADEAGGADVDAAALAALSGNGAGPHAPAAAPPQATTNGRGGAPPGPPGATEGTDGDAVEVRS